MGGGPEGRCATHTTHTDGTAECSQTRACSHGGHGGARSDPPHPAFASFWAYGPIFFVKAIYFGKDFLRMAGIVQMLHGLKPPYDKYQYANGIRIRPVQSARGRARDQARPCTQISPTVPGSCSTMLAVSHHTDSHRLLTGHIWPILVNLLVVLVPSITA